MVKITAYSPILRAELTALVNQHIESIPPGWTLTPAQVDAIVNNGGKLWHHRYPADEAPFETLTLIAHDNEKLIGGIQYLFPDDGYHQCLIVWALTLPGYEDALVTLLDAVKSDAQRRRVQVIAVTRFAFGIGWIGIPAQWEHLITGFKSAGYEVSHSWKLMYGSADITVPPLPEHFAHDWRVYKEIAEWDLYLYDQGAFVGACEAWGLAPWFEDCPDFKSWTTIEWLQVERAYRQQGIGKALLGEQLRYQAGRGIKHVMVWCETDNTPVQRLNKSLGFHKVCEAWCPQLVLADNGSW